ncbi:MAG: putative sensor histidine kinase/response regulator hybrid [Alphaproteobacteria bacterium]|jgi:CheY-like chemotaxis protein|nr:putative sensor histidine kinase/response regulator hybrid [Alphaproteobacteria bacterium]MDF3033058.1 putative sensor histidine kinase/response regulator hybrid [Alphaproteobacteria bacterium]
MNTLKILVSPALIAITFSTPQAIHGMERASKNEGQKNPPGMPLQHQEIEKLEKRLYALRGVQAAAQNDIPLPYEQSFEHIQVELRRKINNPTASSGVSLASSQTADTSLRQFYAASCGEFDPKTLEQEAAEARVVNKTDKLRIRESRVLVLHIAALSIVSSPGAHIQIPPLHVLVAEDNHVNQKILRSILKRWGCSVSVVENGREALEAVQRERYDIILMDGEMPEMDGLEATKRIRDTFNKDTLPILGVTSQALPHDRERFLESGMNGYLTKPLNQQDLKAAIWDCLGSCGRLPKSVSSD